MVSIISVLSEPKLCATFPTFPSSTKGFEEMTFQLDSFPIQSIVAGTLDLFTPQLPVTTTGRLSDAGQLQFHQLVIAKV